MGWLYPLFTVSNITLIQKCGLDAYFFLRFLRMLLKIFLPMALIVLPILWSFRIRQSNVSHHIAPRVKIAQTSTGMIGVAVEVLNEGQNRETHR